MSGNFARDKGQRGEREVNKILQAIIDKVYVSAGFSHVRNQIPFLERNQMQSYKGGCDIVGIDWIAIEVKHQETFHLKDWWSQCERQARKEDKMPVLFYRKNNIKFRVMMELLIPVRVQDRLKPGKMKTVKTVGPVPVDMSLEAFLVYFEHQLISNLEH